MLTGMLPRFVLNLNNFVIFIKTTKMYNFNASQCCGRHFFLGGYYA